ncbi:hypothetical protein GCM10009665_74010 [Kitasatospora nipponensis]|uniref:Putative sensor domain-containing protein n=1 Tax=Kitasatospora nipponensis TaxID=258049 RepID=A0ABP4DR09_9ACTN
MTTYQDFADDRSSHLGATRHLLSDGPSFWRAPFAGRSRREFGYTVTSLLTATAGFVWTVTLFSLGAGLLVTVLGFPVLALLLIGARAFGAVERARAARLLDCDVPAPAPASSHRTGWAALTARLADPAGWRAAAYQLVMFPWHVTTFVLSVTLWSCSLAMALLPLYSWVFPTFVGWPGYKLFDYDSNGAHHTYYLSSVWQIAGASLVGILLVFVTARVVHLLTGVSRAATRALLGG